MLMPGHSLWQIRTQKKKPRPVEQRGQNPDGGQVDVSGHIKGAQKRRQIRTVGYRACRRQPQDFTNPLPGTVAELANCQCVPFPADRHPFMWHPQRPQPAPGWGRFVGTMLAAVDYLNRVALSGAAQGHAKRPQSGKDRLTRVMNIVGIKPLMAAIVA